jgi:hypothetical protein
MLGVVLPFPALVSYSGSSIEKWLYNDGSGSANLSQLKERKRKEKIWTKTSKDGFVCLQGILTEREG